MKTLLKATAVLLGLLAAHSAHAITYGFSQLTNNAAGAIATQLSVDVTDQGTGFALKFTNTGAIASNISEIYATAGKTFGALSITDSGVGVAFSAGGTPAGLPGSSNGLLILASADSPAPSNGVNLASEWVTLSFTYGGSFANFASLTSQLNSGSLQLGLHVTGIAPTGNSNSFVTQIPPGNTPGVPDGGATVVLLGVALAGLGLIRRRLA
jgi:hypothetical protein